MSSTPLLKAAKSVWAKQLTQISFCVFITVGNIFRESPVKNNCKEIVLNSIKTIKSRLGGYLDPWTFTWRLNGAVKMTENLLGGECCNFARHQR